jgi:leader peptidase (prepilin peptidase) / N-methyltransferase
VSAQVDIVLSMAGLLLMALPALPPTGARLARMVRKGWPRSLINRHRGGPTILDAAVLLAPLVVIPVVWMHPSSITLTLGLGCVLATLILFDLRYRWLPDQLTLPLIAIGVLVGSLIGDGMWLTLAALVGAGGSAWLIGEGFYRLRGVDGLGGGDMKLMAAIGAWCGPQMTPLVIAFAAISALVIEVTIQGLRHGRLDATRRIPFGVYLAGAFWCAWLAQATLR